MTSRAPAFAFEDCLTPRPISIGRRSPAAGGRQTQICQNGSRLKIGKVVWRHRRPRNAVFNDADDAVFVGRSTEFTVSQIHAIHKVAFRAMTGDAVGAKQLASIFDVGGTVAVLSA